MPDIALCQAICSSIVLKSLVTDIPDFAIFEQYVCLHT